MSVRYLLYDRTSELRSAFSKLIEAAKNVERPFVNNATIEVLPYDAHIPFADVVKKSGVDAIVSPGNSFGFMHGGFDAVISKYYASLTTNSEELTLHVQRLLREKVEGYNPPTNALVLSMAGPIEKPNTPHLVHVPTMTLPHKIPCDTPTVFNCMWSVLNAVKLHNKSVSTCEGIVPITTVLMPGLGTGVGEVSSKSCANQVMSAFQLFNQPLQEEHNQKGGMSMGLAARIDTLIEKSCK